MHWMEMPGLMYTGRSQYACAWGWRHMEGVVRAGAYAHLDSRMDMNRDRKEVTDARMEDHLP